MTFRFYSQGSFIENPFFLPFRRQMIGVATHRRVSAFSQRRVRQDVHLCARFAMNFSSAADEMPMDTCAFLGRPRTRTPVNYVLIFPRVTMAAEREKGNCKLFVVFYARLLLFENVAMVTSIVIAEFRKRSANGCGVVYEPRGGVSKI